MALMWGTLLIIAVVTTALCFARPVQSPLLYDQEPPQDVLDEVEDQSD